MSAAPSFRRIADQAAAEALFVRLRRWPREMMAIAYLDPNWRLLALRHLAGEHDRVTPPFRMILRDVLGSEAAKVIVAHSHPSGDAEPSRDDLTATRLLAQMLRPLGVTLVDHLVIGAGAVTSLRVRGAL